MDESGSVTAAQAERAVGVVMRGGGRDHLVVTIVTVPCAYSPSSSSACGVPRETGSRGARRRDVDGRGAGRVEKRLGVRIVRRRRVVRIQVVRTQVVVRRVVVGRRHHPVVVATSAAAHRRLMRGGGGEHAVTHGMGRRPQVFGVLAVIVR